MLRRTKRSVLKELPEKTEATLYCELGASERARYDELRAHYQRALRSRIADVGLGQSHLQVLEALLRLRQASCHQGLIDPTLAEGSSSKLDVLYQHLETCIEGGHKALVFSQFTQLLAIVRRELDRRGIVHEYLDGRTRKRQEHIDRFQEDPECPVFLISLKAGGVGLNLTAADYVFLLDPWWNPATEAQAIDRAHRFGQQNPVFAYRLIARDTVEEQIAELQQNKRDLADALLGSDKSRVQDLGPEDLEILLGSVTVQRTSRPSKRRPESVRSHRRSPENRLRDPAESSRVAHRRGLGSLLVSN